MTWPAGTVGVLTLPSGRRVRGRALRGPQPPGPDAELALWVALRDPRGRPGASPPPGSTVWWWPWPDLRGPRRPALLDPALTELLDRADDERVEVACPGGVGRTGTLLAALAVLDGCDPASAVALVRRGYRRRAVETPLQHRYLRRLALRHPAPGRSDAG